MLQILRILGPVVPSEFKKDKLDFDYFTLASFVDNDRLSPVKNMRRSFWIAASHKRGLE